MVGLGVSGDPCTNKNRSSVENVGKGGRKIGSRKSGSGTKKKLWEVNSGGLEGRSEPKNGKLDGKGGGISN